MHSRPTLLTPLSANNTEHTLCVYFLQERALSHTTQHTPQSHQVGLLLQPASSAADQLPHYRSVATLNAIWQRLPDRSPGCQAHTDHYCQDLCFVVCLSPIIIRLIVSHQVIAKTGCMLGCFVAIMSATPTAAACNPQAPCTPPTPNLVWLPPERYLLLGGTCVHTWLCGLGRQWTLCVVQQWRSSSSK